MLTHSSFIRIVSREFNAPDGRKGTAFFALFNRGGRVVAKLVSVSFDALSKATRPLALCAFCKSVFIEAPKIIGEKIVSLFVETFSLLKSQPTRAPACN